ncbi:ATP-dependent endonuclease [Paraflavitalea soli]|uniref:ATP-dependent endonuclease n=1 Tax=Paraflavitalea soli TaxID=2315862 RepID=A0A3B7MED6_9BACT|nr:AAA family ATPase [Paraflavitalea soli]AXY72694.1 ATP-dependent endonuclease [Paraflavitalea soli]
MKISALRITNFRSFGPITQTLKFNQKLNCFIGLNSSGKTAALDAIRKIFGSQTERLLSKEDFHVPADEGSLDPQEKALSIEIDLCFDEDDPASALFDTDFTLEVLGADPIVRILLEASWAPSVTTPEGEIDAQLYIVTQPSAAGEDNEKKPFPKYMHGVFQVIYIPALRKTADQLRYASGSILHRLLKTITLTDEFRVKVREQVEHLNDLFTGLDSFGAIQQTVQDNWEKFHSDKRFSDATMKFGTGEIDEMLKKLEIHFTPSPGRHRQFKIDDLGDGYRSLFYISMVCVLLQIERQLPQEEADQDNIRPLLTILLVEEPENHIAPQILGRVIKILQDITVQPGTMVLLSSHTPAIVKRLEPESIFHFRITDEDQTEVNDIELPDAQDEAYKYVKEAVQNFPEIYFARVVLIGEGDSEQVIFNHIMKAMDLDFDENLITFAPLGHRFVNHIWKLLTRLKVPYVTLLDLDMGRYMGGWGRVQYALRELISKGEVQDEVLIKRGAPLTDQELDEMHERNYSEQQMSNLEYWKCRLQSYDVFFVRNLDLDFLMLRNFPDYYKQLIPRNGGPRIPDRVEEEEEFKEYIENAVAATLKSKDYPTGLYDDDDRELMIWYNYHFLNRGKPVTHIQALSKIPGDIFEQNIPGIFVDIINRMKKKLGIV